MLSYLLSLDQSLCLSYYLFCHNNNYLFPCLSNIHGAPTARQALSWTLGVKQWTPQGPGLSHSGLTLPVSSSQLPCYCRCSRVLQRSSARTQRVTIKKKTTLMCLTLSLPKKARFPCMTKSLPFQRHSLQQHQLTTKNHPNLSKADITKHMNWDMRWKIKGSYMVFMAFFIKEVTF